VYAKVKTRAQPRDKDTNTLKICFDKFKRIAYPENVARNSKMKYYSEDSNITKDQYLEAYADGEQAYSDGLSSEDNPFGNSDEEWALHCAWNEGWSWHAWCD
jgi:hypothetical protein